MSTGLIALLDDIAGLAKVAAASLDDVSAQAAKAGAKAAGVVIDDAAVTPRYVVGFSATRELPIVAKIALGSLRNKVLFLLPGALVLSLVAPWAITPLLMLGGAYLCYEGAEKIWHAVAPHGPDTRDTAPPDTARAETARAEIAQRRTNKQNAVQPEPVLPAGAKPEAGRRGAAIRPRSQDPQALENAKVRSAIGTDFILSAEIMAITLGTLPDVPLWEQAVVLAIVGIGITLGVYGIVALIVKADDVGVAMAAGERPVSAILRRSGSPSAPDRAVRPVTQAIGRGLVIGMPWFLNILAIIGTAAMVWVGGGIIVHGLAGYGMAEIEHAIHGAAVLAAGILPALAGVAEWIVRAAGSGLVGLLVGAVLIPVATLVVTPLLRVMRGREQAT